VVSVQRANVHQLTELLRGVVVALDVERKDILTGRARQVVATLAAVERARFSVDVVRRATQQLWSLS
jgi:hypothetical protein